MMPGLGRAEAAKVHGVPPGDAQIEQTLQLMARLARAAAINPEIVNAAVDVVRWVDGRDSAALLATLAGWLTRSIAFLPDPWMDGDYLRTPAFLLSEIRQHGIARGDCDDAAVLGAALGMAVGFPARFVAVAFELGGPFVHVWVELRAPDGSWHQLDPTRNGPLPVVHRAMVLEV